MEVQVFYDGLAASYDRLYPDWERELVDQAAALSALLGELPARAAVADVACGIGTQLIGLAAAGHRLYGSDLSPVAVARARSEARARHLEPVLVVADMRALPWRDATMDAVVCADNALPHLLSDDDASAALGEFRRVLRPRGRLVVTIRDYDSLVLTQPSSAPPQVSAAPSSGRTITFQLWHWRDETDVYDLEHFQIHEESDGSSRVERRTTTYRAYTQELLHRLAERAGLTDITWHAPGPDTYFQPAMTATRP